MKRPLRMHPLTAADRMAAWGVLACVLAMGLAVLAAPDGGPRADGEYRAARALARFDGFALELAPQVSLAVGETEAPDRAAGWEGYVRGPDGALRSALPPAGPLLAAPLAWVGARAGRLGPQLEERFRARQEERGSPREDWFARLTVLARDALLLAGLAALTLLSALRVGVSRPAAIASALLLCLASYAWPAARGGQPGILAAFAVALAFDRWLATRESFAGLRRPLRRELLGLGAALGAAWWADPALAPFALVLAAGAAVTVVRGHRALRREPLLRRRSGPRAAGRDLVYLIVPLFVAALGWIAYEGALLGRWDAALRLAQGWLRAFGSAGATELAALLVSPGSGLLWMAPLLLLVPLGWLVLRADPVLRAAMPVLCAALLVPAAAASGDAAGYGPTALLPVLALLGPAAAAGLKRLGEQRGRTWVLVPLIALGGAVALGGVLVDTRTHRDLLVVHTRAELNLGERPGVPLEQALAQARWDWGAAAPWAHWRILRHRVAGLGEEFGSGHVFLGARDHSLAAGEATPPGFDHLAWVDLGRGLEGRPGGVLFGLLLLACAGAVALARALDPARP